MGTDELMAKAQIAKETGAHVEIVGKWVWASFESKPPYEIRQKLLVEGYHWNSKRQVWQFAGVACRYSRAMTGEIKAKYGAVELEEVAA